MTPREVVGQLLRRAGVGVCTLGPLVGMSPAWGQRVLDGTICPDLVTTDKIAEVLGAREVERLALLESVSRVKLSKAGVTGKDLDRAVEMLVEIYRRKAL